MLIETATAAAAPATLTPAQERAAIKAANLREFIEGMERSPLMIKPRQPRTPKAPKAPKAPRRAKIVDQERAATKAANLRLLLARDVAEEQTLNWDEFVELAAQPVAMELAQAAPSVEDRAEEALCALDPAAGGWEAAVQNTLAAYREDRSRSWRSVHVVDAVTYSADGVLGAVAQGGNVVPGGQDLGWGRLAFTKNRWDLITSTSANATDAARVTIAMSLILEGEKFDALRGLAAELLNTGRYSVCKARVTINGGPKLGIAGKAWTAA